jgi:hypothetical protein
MPIQIPLGDALRKWAKAPAWLRVLLEFVRGRKVEVGGAEILLDQDAAGGATPPRTGLDRPHRIEPPKIVGPRR